MNKLLVAALGSVAVSAPLAHSTNIPLEQATITRTLNDVRNLDPRSGSSPARVSQLIKDNIHLESLKPNSGTGIQVADTAQLLALLNTAAPTPGGRIEFVTSGSKIHLGGKVRADHGTITVANNGVEGQINIQIANSKVVTLGGGPATIFTDKASYSTASGGNGTTSGRFQLLGLPGVSTAPSRLPFSLRP